MRLNVINLIIQDLFLFFILIAFERIEIDIATNRWHGFTSCNLLWSFDQLLGSGLIFKIFNFPRIIASEASANISRFYFGMEFIIDPSSFGIDLNNFETAIIFHHATQDFTIAAYFVHYDFLEANFAIAFTWLLFWHKRSLVALKLFNWSWIQPDDVQEIKRCSFI